MELLRPLFMAPNQQHFKQCQYQMFIFDYLLNYASACKICDSKLVSNLGSKIDKMAAVIRNRKKCRRNCKHQAQSQTTP